MALYFFAGLLLASCAGQTAAMALFGWQEPDHNATHDKRIVSAAVLPSYIGTIYSTGDVLKRKTAAFGFGFRVDYGHNLWGFCPDNMVDETDCMIGGCFDEFACSTGCLVAADTALSTVTCTSGNAAFCSMAMLTYKSRVPGATYITCGGVDDSSDVYFGFTVDLLRTEALPATTTTSTPINTSSSETASGPQESPGAGVTPPPKQSEIPSDSGTSSQGSQSNSGSTTTNNIGVIVGGAIGGLVVLCGFILAVVWLLRRNKSATAKSLTAASSTLHDGDLTPAYGKPELEAYERERVELFGRGLSEMSAQGPAAYDTAHYRPNYPPMTPVELPAAHSSWKPTRI